MPRVEPTLFVDGIVIQPDKLAQIDPNNLEIQKLRRGLVNCRVSVEGKEADATLIIDYRADLVTVSLDHPGISAHDFGAKLILMYAEHYHEKSAPYFAGLRENSRDHSYFPIGNNPERFTGFLHFIKQTERGVKVTHGVQG